MLNKIEKLSKVLNESYSEKSLDKSLRTFFVEEFGVDNFLLKIEENKTPIQDESFKIYPLYKHKKYIGSLVFSNVNKILEEFLKYTILFISLKVQNITTNAKMQKSIDFYDTMRNIAKIIETQYDLDYILPIIGEMIDKFFEDYLLYIYLKEDYSKKFKLSWPSACNDEKIKSITEDFNNKTLSEDKKIIGLPLKTEDKIIGILVAKSTNKPITTRDEDYLEQLSAQIAITIHRANMYAEILKHATLDALTGFYNRQQLEERIKQEVANAKRQKAPLCGIMTDIDFFKSINDTYGHAVGDLVLKQIAKVIRGQLREYDIAGRYGGEEFSILLPFTKIDEAQKVAERLRETIENKKIDISKVNPESEEKIISVTISLGIYEIKPSDEDEDLLKKADKALYKAKNTGRNKVVVQDE